MASPRTPATGCSTAMTTRRAPASTRAATAASSPTTEPWKGSRLRYATPPRAAPSARCAARISARVPPWPIWKVSATTAPEGSTRTHPLLGWGWVRPSEPAARSDARTRWARSSGVNGVEMEGEEEGASEEVSAMAGAIVRRRREEASRRREARIIALGTAAGARVRARPRRAAGVAAARIAKRSLPSETRGVSGLGRLLARRRGVDASCGARQALAAGSIPNSLTRVVFVHAGVPMG